MIAAMIPRMCLCVAGASLLLNQAALGCRHYRPSFGEGLRHASVVSRSRDSVPPVPLALFPEERLRPFPRALE
jgi:hypothetical protein